LKTALGFIDADLPYVKIMPDLRTATAQFIEVIGQDTYDDLYAIYTESNDAPDEATTGDNAYMLQLAQYAIATAAYRLFAPANDLQHGVNGRKMLKDEESGYERPYEHMLVASNDDLERRSFRAMDDLLKVLDELSDTWKDSNEYKASHRLFVRTTAEFDMYFPINSRLLLLKLQPGLAQAERREILPRITKEVFGTLKAKRNGTNSTALTATEQVLLSLIQEACVYSALSWSMPRLQATLFPQGILQPVRGDSATIKGRAVPQGNQIDQMAQKFALDAAKVLADIEAVLQPEEVPTPVNSEAAPKSVPFGFDDDSAFVST
jgi:hypothetical protein